MVRRRTPPPTHLAVRVEELPDDFAPLVVYLVGGAHLFCAGMLCPCGCGAKLLMSLVDDDSPTWTATVHRNGSVSLFPSVARLVGCKSHFVLRRGRIRWSRWSWEAW